MGTTSPASRCSTRVQSYVVSLTASTGVALPGGKVTYTVTVKNTGSVDYSATDLVSVTDSLAGIVDDATYDNDATSGASYDQPVLTWGITLPVNATKSFHYSVTIKAPGSGDGHLADSLTTSLGGNCPAAAACLSSVVGLRAYTVAVTADRVGATNGTVVNYVLTVKNAGSVAFTTDTPASFATDLTNVLDDATWTGPVPAGAQYKAPNLTWSGALAVGTSVTLPYSATVNSPDKGNSIMQSTVVTPAGKGGSCAANAGIATCTVVVLISSLRLNLSASPSTMRDPGDLSSFTFMVTNTGQYSVSRGAPDLDRLHRDGPGDRSLGLHRGAGHAGARGGQNVRRFAAGDRG